MSNKAYIFDRSTKPLATFMCDFPTLKEARNYLKDCKFKRDRANLSHYETWVNKDGKELVVTCSGVYEADQLGCNKS